MNDLPIITTTGAVVMLIMTNLYWYFKHNSSNGKISELNRLNLILEMDKRNETRRADDARITSKKWENAFDEQLRTLSDTVSIMCLKNNYLESAIQRAYALSYPVEGDPKEGPVERLNKVIAYLRTIDSGKVTEPRPVISKETVERWNEMTKRLSESISEMVNATKGE